MCGYMSKSIALSDDVYNTLKSLKGDKFFSQVVIELIDARKKKKRSIMDFAGAFKGNADEWKEIEKKIYEDRKKVKMREVW